MFIGRENELRRMKKWLQRKGSTALLLTGRRRVGKTELIKQSLKEESCPIIFFVGNKDISYEDNFQSLLDSVREALHDPYFTRPNLKILLKDLYEESMGGELVLVLDEYCYFRETKPSIDGVLQEAIDHRPEGSNLKLILSGSSVSAMESLLEEENPLRGRFDEEITLHPFGYFDAAKWCPNLTNEEKFEFYAVFGGVPYYLNNVDFSLSLKQNLMDRFIPEDSFFEKEANLTALGEMKKNPDFYKTLLLIARGVHSYKDINASLSQDKAASTVYILRNLLEAKLIKKVAPLNAESDRKSSYYLEDNLLSFYFAFLFGNDSIRASQSAEMVYSHFENVFRKNYLPKKFEATCEEYLIRRNKASLIDPPFSALGNFVFHSKEGNAEFDVVTEDERGYTDYECKYWDKPVGKEVILKEMADAKKLGIPFYRFGFFSRKGFEEDVDQKNMPCYSLDQIYQPF